MAEHNPSLPNSSAVTRRRIVKAGAHAAWAVPVVTVLAAAPAFAVDSPTAVLTLDNLSVTYDGTVVTVNVTINNAGPMAAVNVLASVTLTPGPRGTADFSATTADIGGTTSSTGTDITFSYAFGDFPAEKGSGPRTGKYTLSPKAGPGSVTVKASANNAVEVSSGAVPFSLRATTP